MSFAVRVIAKIKPFRDLVLFFQPFLLLELMAKGTTVSFSCFCCYEGLTTGLDRV